MPDRKLRVFLCHASQDKPIVRELYQRLLAEGWIDPWLDEEKLLPGQNWKSEIRGAVESCDAFIACLSAEGGSKEGYIQAELKYALNIALEKPDDTIYLIPLRLNNCELPKRLGDLQYVNYFGKGKEKTYQRLLESLRARAHSLGFISEGVQRITPSGHQIYVFDEIEFIKIQRGSFWMGSRSENRLAYRNEKPQYKKEIDYDYFVGRFTVTNMQYKKFMDAVGKPFDALKVKNNHPVVNVAWQDAILYCDWLSSIVAGNLPEDMVFTLPSEAEWEKAARGDNGFEWPWGNTFEGERCNSRASGNGGTTPVGYYSPLGDSPYGVADMAGNIWEWTRSLWGNDILYPTFNYPYEETDGRENVSMPGYRILRGGAHDYNSRSCRCAMRDWLSPAWKDNYGFRLFIVPASKTRKY